MGAKWSVKLEIRKLPMHLDCNVQVQLPVPGWYRRAQHDQHGACCDPRSMFDVMETLAAANPGGMPEFFSTHPNPDNRIKRIEAAIQALYPSGVPEGLIP